MLLEPITPCPCCGKFKSEGCTNIDHNELQTIEWNNIAKEIAYQGTQEEFHQTHPKGNRELYRYHQENRFKLEKELQKITRRIN